jgi:hypothetical protein
MNTALPWAVIAAAAVAGAPPRLVRFSDPVAWALIDTDTLKGRPAQLAWSDDDTQMYLQTVDGTTPQTITYRHYLIGKDAAPTPIARQPIWAQTYWKWKSAKSFFGDPLLTIEVDTRRDVVDDPRDRNTAYLNSEKRAPATLEAKGGRTRVVQRLLLKRQVIGEFVDEAIFPGYTFSWSPEPLGLIVFRSNAGRLTVMNTAGETETIGDGKDVWLPAWSESGNMIGYLERTGRKTFALKVMTAL